LGLKLLARSIEVSKYRDE